MKLIKKLFTLLAASALLAGGFTGCSNLQADDSNAAIFAAYSQKAYGRVALTLPKDGSGNVVELTNIVLKAGTEVCGTWATTDEVKDATVKIKVGTYTFTLSATYDGDTFSGSCDGTIEENTTTALSFTLKRQAAGGSGDDEGGSKTVGTKVTEGTYAGKYLVMDWYAPDYVFCKTTDTEKSVDVSGSYPSAEDFLASDMSTGQVAILGGAKSKYNATAKQCDYIQLSTNGSTSKGLKFDVPLNTNFIVINGKAGSSGASSVKLTIALSDGSASAQTVTLNAPNQVNGNPGPYVAQEFAYSLKAVDDETQKSIIIYNSDSSSGLNLKGIQVYAETPWDRSMKATSSKTQSANSGTYEPAGQVVTVDMTVTTEATSTGSSVNIKKAEGWLNSAYVIFDGTASSKYTITCDGNAVDNELIRFYSTYKYNTNSYNDGQTTWTPASYNNVWRVDVLGLAAGEHTISITPQGGSATTVKATVLNNDRSGYAFSGTETPGAYNKDGTLKSNAVVLYVTKDTAKTVTYNGQKGIQKILDESQVKNYTVPLDIRFIGQVNLSDLDYIASSAEGLQVKNNKSPVTIEGVGHDATVTGFGIFLRESTHVEVANLGVMNFLDDGLSFDTKNYYTWVHNVDLFYGQAGGDSDQAKGDGSLDVKGKSNWQSYSYLHFWDSGKMSLCGMKSETADSRLTYHHNWFDHSDSRHPRIRVQTVHIYNNYYDGNSKYGVGVTMGASAFAEGNIFRNPHDPMMSSGQGTDATGDGTFSGETGGWIKAYNNMFFQLGNNGVKFQFMTNKDAGWTSDDNDIDCYIVDNRTDTVPALKTVSGGTTYNNFDTKEDLHLAEGSLTEPAVALNNVVKFAGRHNPDFAFTFDNTTEDANYKVNATLKAAVTAYKNTGLTKIGN